MDQKNVAKGSGAPCASTIAGKLDAKLLAFGQSHEKLMSILDIAYRVIGLAIALVFGYFASKIAGVLGFQGFMETAFAGLGLQTAAFNFYNGTVTSVVLLLIVFGLLSAFMISPARIICDAAALYTLFFASTMPVDQFSAVVAPIAVVYAIWIVQRLLLGTIVFRYRKISNR